MHPVSLLATLVLLFGFQGEQVIRQPLIIALLAVPILIQVFFNSGLAYLLNRAVRSPHCVAGPGSRFEPRRSTRAPAPMWNRAGTANAGDALPGDGGFGVGHRLLDETLTRRQIPAGRNLGHYLSSSHLRSWRAGKSIVRRLFRAKLDRMQHKYFSGHRSQEVVTTLQELPAADIAARPLPMTDKTPDLAKLQERIRQLQEKAHAADILGKQAFKDRQFLQILIDTIPSPIFYKDNGGIYRHCNDAFSVGILGLPKDEIINKSLFDLPDRIPADLAQIYHEKDRALFENPGTQTYTGDVRCSDGSIRRFRFFKSTILNETGNADGLVGIMLDITSMEVSRSKLVLENSKLQSLSFIDGLTGVYNRRKFESVFPALLKGAGQSSSVLNFAIMDIDQFKLFNDNYGHPAGDETLKAVADTIRKNLRRPDDHVFRIGGEEFCLLFHSRDESDAMEVAEKTRTDVEKLALVHAHNGDRGIVTLSTGLLSIRTPTIDWLQVYEQADRQLYNAKSGGRNRTVQGTL